MGKRCADVRHQLGANFKAASSKAGRTNLFLPVSDTDTFRANVNRRDEVVICRERVRQTFVNNPPKWSEATSNSGASSDHDGLMPSCCKMYCQRFVEVRRRREKQ